MYVQGSIQKYIYTIFNILSTNGKSASHWNPIQLLLLRLRYQYKKKPYRYNWDPRINSKKKFNKKNVYYQNIFRPKKKKKNEWEMQMEN